MSLAPGSRLGPYEVTAVLGTGGMGEVYRARDTRIGREVAVKVLPAGLARDETRLRRFEVEARAAGSLSHPNVLVLFDVGSEDGAPYVVTELLEGETLRERLSVGALPVRKAIEIASQAARGLGAAHQKGIVHRDLKPENLFLTLEGRVKILDFGLAKLTEPAFSAPPDAEPSQPTVSGPGQVLGTVGYMAPEQVEGRPAGSAADVFALGAVLYEMLSGRRAFQGDSVVDTLHAIVRRDPPELAPEVTIPLALEHIVRRCLEKRPEERFHSAHDLAFALETLSGTGASLDVRPARADQVPPRWLQPVVATALVTALLGAGWLIGRLLRSPETTAPRITRLTFRRQGIWQARFAPDGQTIVYGASYQHQPVEVFATRIGSPEARSLGVKNANLLAISPTGELALKLGESLSGTLAQMSLEGGTPRELLTGVAGAAWSRDGRRLAIIRTDSGSRRLEYPIGNVLADTSGPGGSLRLSPVADLIAVQWREHGSPVLAIVDPSQPAPQRLRTLLRTVVAGYCWAPDGQEIRYVSMAPGTSEVRSISLSGRDRSLMTLPGDFILQDCRGDGALLVERVNVSSEIGGFLPDDTSERDLSWFDSSEAVDLAPDGRTLLFAETFGESFGTIVTLRSRQAAVYLRTTDGSAAVRLGEGRPLALSPDGRWALTRTQGPPQAHVALPTGAGEARRYPLPPLTALARSRAEWFSDSRRFVFNAAAPGQEPRCYLQSIEGGGPQAIAPAGVGPCRLPSPDARVLIVDGPRLFDLTTGVARPAPGVVPSDDVVRWSADGRALFVVERPTPSSARVHRVDLASGRRELVRALRTNGPLGSGNLVNVLVSADGGSIVYTTARYFSDLLLIEGLR